MPNNILSTKSVKLDVAEIEICKNVNKLIYFHMILETFERVDNKEFKVKIATIADRMNVSYDTVWRYIKIIEKLGWTSVINTKKKTGRKGSNIYQLTQAVVEDYTIIPTEVILCDDLVAVDVIVYAKINRLLDNKKFVYAETIINIANHINIDVKTVRASIKKLVAAGFIKHPIENKKENRKKFHFVTGENLYNSIISENQHKKYKKTTVEICEVKVNEQAGQADSSSL